MATLRLVPLAPASGLPVEVKGDMALVGREPGCDVLVSDGSVSRKHARLEKRGSGWTVVDQGSANGTFLDSQRVAEAAIKSGQEIRFGAIAFRVEFESDEDLIATMMATPSPDATVVAPAQMVPTPPLGVPTSAAKAAAPPAAAPASSGSAPASSAAPPAQNSASAPAAAGTPTKEAR
jgi:pSer/pThr/pTyr-binding forkhead associated (FHA) protein